MRATQSQNAIRGSNARRSVHLKLSDLQLTNRTSSVPLTVQCSVELDLPHSLIDTTLCGIATLVKAGKLWLMKATPCQMDVGIHVDGRSTLALRHSQWLADSVEKCSVWDDLRVTLRKQELPDANGLERDMVMSFVINHPHLLSESLASAEIPCGRFLGLKFAFIYGAHMGDNIPMSPLRKGLPLRHHAQSSKTSPACNNCRAKKRRCNGTALDCKKIQQTRGESRSTQKPREQRTVSTPNTERQVALRARPRTRASGRIRYAEHSDSDTPDEDGPNYNPLASPSRRALRARDSKRGKTGGNARAIKNQQATEEDMTLLVKAAFYKLFGFRKTVARVKVSKELEAPNLLDIAPAVWNMQYLQELTSRVTHIPWIASCFSTLNAESPSIRVKLATLVNERDAPGAQLEVERKLHQLAHRGLEVPPPAPLRLSPSVSGSQIIIEPNDESQPIVIVDSDIDMEPLTQKAGDDNSQSEAADMHINGADDDFMQPLQKGFDVSQEIDQAVDHVHEDAVPCQLDEISDERMDEADDDLLPRVEQEVGPRQEDVSIDQFVEAKDEETSGAEDNISLSQTVEQAMDLEQEQVVPHQLYELGDELADRTDDDLSQTVEEEMGFEQDYAFYKRVNEGGHDQLGGTIDGFSHAPEQETGHSPPSVQVHPTQPSDLGEQLDKAGAQQSTVEDGGLFLIEGQEQDMDLGTEDTVNDEANEDVERMGAQQADDATRAVDNGMLRSIVQLGWRWAARIF